MKRIDDMNRWTEAALDTPFATTISLAPGACVKSHEREGGWPKFFGRVVQFDTERDYALVRSYGSRFDHSMYGSDPKLAGTLWEGTVAECRAMWEVD